MTELIKETAVAEARVAVLEAETTKLRDENQRLRAELQLHEAQRTAASAWQDDAYSHIPAKIKALFENAALAQMPMLDGKLDAAKLLTLVQESADEYLQHLPVSAVGVTGNDSQTTDRLEESRQKQIDKLMTDYNLTEAQARKAYGA